MVGCDGGGGRRMKNEAIVPLVWWSERGKGEGILIREGRYLLPNNLSLVTGVELCRV